MPGLVVGSPLSFVGEGWVGDADAAGSSDITLVAAHFAFAEAAGVTISSAGDRPFPPLTLNGVTTHLWDVPDALSIDAAGNFTTRVYGNADVDDMMRLDDLTGAYKCKWWACWLSRPTAGNPIVVNMRMGQYGDQGSNPNETGGWVWRWNPGNTITVAIHGADRPGFPKPGSQDAQYTSGAFTDQQMADGIPLVFAVNNSVSPYRVELYTYGVFNGSDEPGDVAWGLPGISNNPPPNDPASAGLTLFNRSENVSQNPLTSAVVKHMWLGRAVNTAHLADIAARLAANPGAFPGDPQVPADIVPLYGFGARGRIGARTGIDTYRRIGSLTA
jgi:hypothetical protein